MCVCVCVCVCVSVCVSMCVCVCVCLLLVFMFVCAFSEGSGCRVCLNKNSVCSYSGKVFTLREKKKKKKKKNHSPYVGTRDTQLSTEQFLVSPGAFQFLKLPFMYACVCFHLALPVYTPLRAIRHSVGGLSRLFSVCSLAASPRHSIV